MRYELLLVAWIDARQSESSSNYDSEELQGRPLAFIRSVGWGYVLKDKVVIAMEYFPQSSMQTEGFRVVATIPKGCISKIQRLGIKE